MSDETAAVPDVGTFVRDVARNEVGRVMGKVGPYVLLRPVKGGREWEVRPDDVEELSTGEALAIQAAEENRQRGEYRHLRGSNNGRVL